MVLQLAPLAAEIVRVPHEAALVGLLEEHGARRRAAALIYRGHGHGIRLRHAGVDRLLEPGAKLHQGIRMDAILVERIAVVFAAHVAQIDARHGVSL